jgi:hypothetical protein
MNFSPHSRSKSRKSFVALLLQPTVHNFGALAPINRLDGITHRRNSQKTRKSFIALLLPLFVPVSPLLRYSYKKMGGVPPVRTNLAPSSATPLVFYHLRKKGGVLMVPELNVPLSFYERACVC